MFLLLIFAVEVAAGIWGLSNKEVVVEEVTEFYRQTYNNYKDTRQEALKETLRLIHFGVRSANPFWVFPPLALLVTPFFVFPRPQLNCCGLTGTVIDAVKDICPKKEGLEALITTVTASRRLAATAPALDALTDLFCFAGVRDARPPSTRCSTTSCTSSEAWASASASSW